MRASPRGRSICARLVVAALAMVAVAPHAIGASQPTAASREPVAEVRALWVTRATLTSPNAIAQMVRAAQSGGFNTLLVQIRARADAYYTSTLEPRASDLAARPGFDPLAETLTVAHASGLKVHAWVVLNLVSSAVELPSSREHLVYRQPDWLMVPRDLASEMLAIDQRSPEYVGRLARWTRARANDIEGLYVSPINPAVSKHLADVVGEIAARYDVDGIHLDYARFPNDSFDYSRTALQQFKQSIRGELSEADRSRADARELIDPAGYPDLFPQRWDNFRRSRMTALMMRLRTVVKSARPRAIFSAAVVPDVEQAHDDRLQDWRTWLDQSLIDVLCPMAYSKDLAVFQEQIATARDLAGDRPVWAGIGAYRLTVPETLEHINAARLLKTAGLILFSYEALTTAPNSMATFTTLSRAAFGTGSE